MRWIARLVLLNWCSTTRERIVDYIRDIYCWNAMQILLFFSFPLFSTEYWKIRSLFIKSILWFIKNSLIIVTKVDCCKEPLHESILWFIKNSLIIVTKVDCCHSFQDLIKLCPKVVQFHRRQSWGRKRENENLFIQFIRVKFYLKMKE
jgi:hypothetical protein